jgi:hypothetical protein
MISVIPKGFMLSPGLQVISTQSLDWFCARKKHLNWGGSAALPQLLIFDDFTS